MKRLVLLAVMAGCAPQSTHPVGKMLDAMERRQQAGARSIEAYQAQQLEQIRARLPDYLALCRASMRGAPPTALTACSQQQMRADVERIAAEVERRNAALDRETDRAIGNIQRQQDAIDLVRLTAPAIPAPVICNRFGATTICN